MRETRRSAAAFAAFAAAALLADRDLRAEPTPHRGLGLPPDASVHGHRVDELLYDTLGAVAFLFAVALAVLVWTVARHRSGHQPRYSHGSRGSIRLVIAAALLFAVVVDGSLLVRTWGDRAIAPGNLADLDRDPRAVRIEVSAHQWAWLARYPGPDGQFASEDDIVTVSDIRVPVAAPILIQLASADVVHSFSLPNFRVKQDAIPGAVNGLTFEARVRGQYEIVCAQHCGPGHYKMRGVLTVLSREEYTAWLSRAAADARLTRDPADEGARWGWPWRPFSP